MKNEERPSCNEPRDVIEDAIDFAKRDPKRTLDERKTPQPNRHDDDKNEKSGGGKVAARSRTFSSFAAIL
jgi:hypothetical protein